MSNPMNLFRKRQKLMLAILGIMCMLGFIVVPTVMDLGSARAARDSVAATTRYGNVMQQELQQMQLARRQANFFFQQLQQQLGIPPQQIEQQFLGPDSEIAVLDTMLLGRKAAELGIVISDQSVNEFIKSIVDDRLTGDQVRAAIQEQQVPPRRLYEILRNEVAARRMRQTFVSGLSGLPPAQRWEYYLRLRRMATAQLLPLAVSDFVGEVPEPTDQQLTDYFDRYKERLAVSGSPEPGFKVPQKVAVQYLKADFDRFVKEVEKDITDKDIEEFYEENKDRRYTALDLPFNNDSFFPGGNAPGDDEAGAEAAEGLDMPVREDVAPVTPAADEASADEAPADEAPADEAATDEAPADGGTDDAATPAADEPTTDEPASEEPAGEAPADDDAADSSEEPATDEQLDAAFEEALAEDLALAQADAEQPAEGEPAATPQASDANGDDSAAEPSVEAAAAEETPVEEEPAEDSATAPVADGDTAAPAEDKPTDDKPAGSGSTTTPKTPDTSIAPKPKYQPLSEVKDRVRRDLAAERATARMAEIMEEIKPQFDDYYYALVSFKAGTEKQEPKRPNLDELVTRFGLTEHQTPLESFGELSQTDVGRSAELRLSAGGQVSLLQLLFTSLQPNKPVITSDSDGNQYLAWKTEETKEKVPALTDPGIRDAVIQSWKLEQARVPARRKADELAVQARDAGKPLKVVFADRKDPGVVETQPFPWLRQPRSMSFFPEPPEIPSIMNADASGAVFIADPGEAFMETVFHLPQEGIGVAANQPQTHLYVIQIVSFAPSEAVLRETFLHDRLGTYVGVAQLDFSRIDDDWMQKLRDEAGLHWEKTPDQIASR